MFRTHTHWAGQFNRAEAYTDRIGMGPNVEVFDLNEQILIQYPASQARPLSRLRKNGGRLFCKKKREKNCKEDLIDKESATSTDISEDSRSKKGNNDSSGNSDSENVDENPNFDYDNIKTNQYSKSPLEPYSSANTSIISGQKAESQVDMSNLATEQTTKVSINRRPTNI